MHRIQQITKDEVVLLPQKLQVHIRSINAEYSHKSKTHLHIYAFELHTGFAIFLSEGYNTGSRKVLVESTVGKH